MFLKAVEITGKTDGAFDITVAPVVNAWGFGFADEVKADSSIIDSLMNFVGMDKVKLTNDMIIKESEGVMLDGNAISQGLSVDVLCKYLESKEIVNYMVEVGGELKTKGTKSEGKSWRVGIDTPIDGNFSPGEDLQAILNIKNKALATSGNYRSFFEDENGNKFSHSINPKTGFPEKQSILSATIITDNCMTADAYATACMVSGLEKSKKIIENNPKLEAYLIFSDKDGKMQVWQTSKLKDWLVE